MLYGNIIFTEYLDTVVKNFIISSSFQNHKTILLPACLLFHIGIFSVNPTYKKNIEAPSGGSSSKLGITTNRQI